MSSLSCPVELDTKKLRTAVFDMYTRVARDPEGDFHFHRGAEYAAGALGYDRSELDALPDRSTRSFAGVGNPHAIARVQSGETVLDVGSGAGMDLLLAAQRVGPEGRAIGVDMTDEMILACREAAREAGLDNVELRKGDIHDLPAGDSSVDVVISNGVLNLAHDKRRAFSEVFRILRPGGRLQLADIVVKDDLSDAIREDYELWAAWIGGALPAGELVEVLGALGFSGVREVQSFDPFLGTRKEKTARRYAVRGVNVVAVKPD